MNKNNWLSNRINESKQYQNQIWDQGINDLSIISRGENRLIVDSSGKEYIDFMSCSYLGLETHPALIESVKASTERYGVQYAAARTRAKCIIFDELEEQLNTIFLHSNTVIFNSVGATHLAVMPILGSGELPGYPIKENGVAWIIDKTTHATVQVLRGILEQFGSYTRLPFADMEGLSSAVEKAYQENKTPVLISDSLGSMGGAVEISEILKLADKYQGYFYVDDAHGTSIIGANGCGYTLNKLGKFPNNLILISSLAKAFGSHGGSVSFKSDEAVKFIKRYSLNYIFSGPPSLPRIAACKASA